MSVLKFLAELLSRRLGQEPHGEVDPDLCVVLGAAVQAEAGMRGRADGLEGRFGFLELYGAGETRGWEGHGAGTDDAPAIEWAGLTVKRHPCCGSAHNTLDCVLALQAEHGFAASEVERVDALVGSVNARNLMYPTPRDEMEARFSLPYCVAAALQRGRLSLADFQPEAVRRPEVLAMLPRIPMTGRDPGDEPTDPGVRLPHEVRVRLADGTVLERARTWARGAVQDPLDAADRRVKFADCVAPALGAAALQWAPTLGFPALLIGVAGAGCWLLWRR